MKSLFEQMGGTYSQVGDYLIPNLLPPEGSGKPLGKYGRMRHSFLKEHRSVLQKRIQVCACKIGKIFLIQMFTDFTLAPLNLTEFHY